MKKLIIVIAAIISLIGFGYINTLDASFGIKLPFGWAVKSDPLLEEAQCIQGVAPYNRGMPFYSIIYDGIGSCGNPVSVNIIAAVLNFLIVLTVGAVFGYVAYRLLLSRKSLMAPER